MSSPGQFQMAETDDHGHFQTLFIVKMLVPPFLVTVGWYKRNPENLT